MSDTLQTATKWTGFIAGLLTFVLGLIHIFKVKARVEWPKGDFIRDDQSNTWRLPLFTFIPDLFIDIWSPFIFGIIGLACHFKQISCIKGITKNFARYFLYLLATALFGNFGYNGGFGIICAAVTLLACLLSLITFLAKDGDASLDLNLGFKVTARNG